ncbi:MAG: Smr/MutS family protein [Rubricoccaceae bacterium]
MPRPSLSDDGQTVVLDLHGATVAEAERLLVRVVSLAADRGRSVVRVVHGHSTTDAQGGAQTIKRRVHALLDEGRLAHYVTSALRAEGHALLGLAVTGRRNPRRLTTADLRLAG